MLIKMYHGSNNFDHRQGYLGGKPGNFHMGFGLYLTNSYRWADNYGRRHYELDLDLCSTGAAHNVWIPTKHFMEFIRVYCTKKFFTMCCKEFKDRESLNVERVELLIINMERHVTKIAKPFAEFVAAWGCTHSIEISGNYGGVCLRLYDFSTIKNCIISQETQDFYYPDELTRYPKKTCINDSVLI